MTNNRETAENLRKAAEIIETHGWVQNKLGNAEVGVCALGALDVAHNGFTDRHGHERWGLWLRVPGVGALANFINEDGDGHPAEIPAWNDHNDTDQALVVKTLLACADDIEVK